MNNMMPGVMPQGSQNSFMQPQPTMYGQGFPAVPGVSGVQAARPRTIPGRMIYSPDEIVPQEVPMDGSVSLFPMHDWSCVYGKWWTSNGQIQTVKFVLESPKKEIDESAVSLSDISARLEKVERYLFKNKHKNNRPATQNQNAVAEPKRSEENG